MTSLQADLLRPANCVRPRALLAEEGWPYTGVARCFCHPCALAVHPPPAAPAPPSRDQGCQLPRVCRETAPLKGAPCAAGWGCGALMSGTVAAVANCVLERSAEHPRPFGPSRQRGREVAARASGPGFGRPSPYVLPVARRCARALLPVTRLLSPATPRRLRRHPAVLGGTFGMPARGAVLQSPDPPIDPVTRRHHASS